MGNSHAMPLSCDVCIAAGCAVLWYAEPCCDMLSKYLEFMTCYCEPAVSLTCVIIASYGVDH